MFEIKGCRKITEFVERKRKRKEGMDGWVEEVRIEDKGGNSEVKLEGSREEDGSSKKRRK